MPERKQALEPDGATEIKEHAFAFLDEFTFFVAPILFEMNPRTVVVQAHVMHSDTLGDIYTIMERERGITRVTRYTTGVVGSEHSPSVHINYSDPVVGGQGEVDVWFRNGCLVVKRDNKQPMTVVSASDDLQKRVGAK